MGESRLGKLSIMLGLVASIITILGFFGWQSLKDLREPEVQQPRVPDSPVAQNLTCPADGPVEIFSVATGKVLDIPNASPNDHVLIQQFPENGGHNQHWFFLPVGGNWYSITSRATGKVLDIPNASGADNVQIQQFPDNGGANQHWRCVSVGDDRFKIVSQSSGKVLDVPYGSADDHVIIQQYADNGGANQQWRLLRV